MSLWSLEAVFTVCPRLCKMPFYRFYNAICCKNRYQNRAEHPVNTASYLLNDNIGFVNLGTSSDTSEFAVESIRRWLKEIGFIRFPDMKRLLIHADCGGSNRANGRLWRMNLAKLAEETGIEIHVIHYPPGASKWNKVEHRLFSYITLNWQGKPLADVQCVINLIRSTTTKTGLSVRCQPDWNEYAVGLKVSDEELSMIDIQYTGPHIGWSYIIHGFKY